MHLVTGGSGFIGRRLCIALGPAPLRVLARSPVAEMPTVVVDLAHANAAVLAAACEGVGTVFHCAGYAHAWNDRDPEVILTHRRINFEATRALVDAAGRSGVRRFVFLSSVKAMGAPGEQCVDENWSMPPETAYGQSKRAAEEAVLEAGAKYGMHVVNLRLVMVYGRGGRGNLERMVGMIRRGWFPALPETGNRRSLVQVDDVVSAMCQVAERPEAAGKTYIVADPQTYSGRQIYEHIRTALGCHLPGRAVPENWLRTAARCGDVLGGLMSRRMPFDSESLNKLLGWACYSPARIKQDIGWQARVPLAQGLADELRIDNAR